jgi:peptide deformylase
MGIVIFGDKILNSNTKEIKEINKEIKEIAKELKKEMIKNRGVGLAANQLGYDISMFVAQHKGKFYTIINPKIIKTSKEKIILEEACLSIPNKFGLVERYKWVVVSGKMLNGKEKKIKASGILSQIFQHEIDHLNGILYIQKAKKIFEIEGDKIKEENSK